MKIKKSGLLAVGLLCLSAVFSAAWAQDDEEAGKKDLIKSRTYLGIMGVSSTIDQWGDFQGLFSFYSASGASSNPEQDIVPSITRQFGWGVIAGHREGAMACEATFMRSDHTASYTGGTAVTVTEPASLSSISFDFKRYFLTTLPAQPFVSMGISFPWLWVRQGSYLLDPTLTTVLMVNDETISGIGFNLGAGIEVYATPEIAIVAGAFQRWTSFDQINGAAKIPLNQMYFNNNPLDVGAIEGDGLHLYLGTTFGFQM